MGAVVAARVRGFTLIEVLVVVGIIAIVTLASLAGARPNPVSRAETEARRIATLLELAYAESGFRGQPISWAPRPGGYSFAVRGADGEWAELGAETPLRPRALPTGLELRGSRVVLSARGLNPPAQAVVAGGGAAFSIRSGLLGQISVQRLHAD